MILYKTKNSETVRVDGGTIEGGAMKDCPNILYFETYEEYEQALNNNEIKENTLITIQTGQDTATGTPPSVDSTLSSTSENPVQSKVIYEKFNEVINMINNTNALLGTQMTFTLNGTDLVIRTL